MSTQKDDRSFESDSQDEENEDTQSDRYLTFSLGDEDYGIAIQHVIEIVGIQRITVMPDMPSYVKGVINLRGQVIPVIELRTKFGMPAREHDGRTCVIVIRIGERSTGLIVDTVREVRDIPPADVSPPPAVAGQGGTGYIRGLGKVGEDVKILLDATKLLVEALDTPKE